MKTYFNNPRTAEELRKQYINLLKRFHPDNGGTDADAQAINAEYEILFARLKNIHEAAAGTEKEREKTRKEYDVKIDAALRDAINKIIHLENITITICGCWVWVSGNTYPVKDALKAAGYGYSRSKKLWYYHDGEYDPRRRGSYSMEKIKSIYGAVEVQTEKQMQLA